MYPDLNRMIIEDRLKKLRRDALVTKRYRFTKRQQKMALMKNQLVKPISSFS